MLGQDEIAANESNVGVNLKNLAEYCLRFVFIYSK